MYQRDTLIEQTDPELWAALLAENARQEHHIELIASDTYASPAVMAASAAKVQAHCGASANDAVFPAFLKPGHTINCMSLAEGGHLTHGMP